MRAYLTILLCGLAAAVCAQSPDTLLLPTDSVDVESSSGGEDAYVDTLGVGFFKKILAPVYPNPERAAAMSFVVPGAGQIYNKRFWYLKVPVIYAGSAWLIWRGEENRKLKDRYDVAYRASIEGEPHEFDDQRNSSPEALRNFRDRLGKNFQLSYIGLVILHLVQTLEAYTAAHLLDFDIDDSLSVSPTLLSPSGGTGFGAAAGGDLRPGLRISIPIGGQ